METRRKLGTMRGKHHTEEAKQKISKGHLENRNPQWKGDNVGKGALHDWIKSRLLKPEVCQFCGQEKKLDLANKSQEYLRDLSDWLWLCRKCHVRQDGRLKNLRRGNS